MEIITTIYCIGIVITYIILVLTYEWRYAKKAIPELLVASVFFPALIFIKLIEDK